MTPKERLKEAKSLLDLGLISQAEFDEIKLTCLKELGLLGSEKPRPKAPPREDRLTSQRKSIHNGYLVVIKDISTAAKVEHPTQYPKLGTADFETWAKETFCETEKILIRSLMKVYRTRFPDLIWPKVNLNPSSSSFDIFRSNQAVLNWMDELTKFVKQQNRGIEVDLPEKYRKPRCKECGESFSRDGFWARKDAYCSNDCAGAEDRRLGTIQYIKNGQMYTL